MGVGKALGFGWLGWKGGFKTAGIGSTYNDSFQFLKSIDIGFH